MKTDKTNYDLIVIGSGPSGYISAIKAAALGMNVALIEKDHLGGTCLNVGCIPTKTFIRSAKSYGDMNKLKDLGISFKDLSFSWQKVLKRKNDIVEKQRKGLNYLMKKNKIEIIKGTASFVNTNEIEILDNKKQITCLKSNYFVIATGSRVKKLPFVEYDNENILDSNSILDIKDIPKSLAVIGAGVVGLEFAFVFANLGSKVTIIENAANILPNEDEEIIEEFKKYLKKIKISLKLSCNINNIRSNKDSVKVLIDGENDINFSKVLISAGRTPETDNLNLKDIGINISNKFIEVDKNYQTNHKNIYAVGDVINTPAFAHTAYVEGIYVAEYINNLKPYIVDYSINPRVMYTSPEIASIGDTEKSIKTKNIEYKVAKFFFEHLAKPKIDQNKDGFIKIIYSKKYKEILGVHIIGAHASEMISQFSLAKSLESTIEDLNYNIYPHPTMSEVIWELSNNALDKNLHI